jgi:hypothetical protein
VPTHFGENGLNRYGRLIEGAQHPNSPIVVTIEHIQRRYQRATIEKVLGTTHSIPSVGIDPAGHPPYQLHPLESATSLSALERK